MPSLTLEQTLVKALHEQRARLTRRDALKRELKDLQEELDLNEPPLLKLMETLGLQNVKVEGVGLVYLAQTPYPKVHNPEAFIKWLDEQGEGAIAKRTVNSKTLQSWFKDRLENGSNLPPEEVMSHYLDKEVRFRKA